MIVTDVQTLRRLSARGAGRPAAGAALVPPRLGHLPPRGQHQGHLLEPQQYTGRYSHSLLLKNNIQFNIIHYTDAKQLGYINLDSSSYADSRLAGRMKKGEKL